MVILIRVVTTVEMERVIELNRMYRTSWLCWV